MENTLLFLLSLGSLFHCTTSDLSPPEVVYEWLQLNFDFPVSHPLQTAIDNGGYVEKKPIIAGIKWHGGNIYVTTPRWSEGIPSTLNKVVPSNDTNLNNGSYALQAFPNWAMQELKNCTALQMTLSMEIDPTTNTMWILDMGRIIPSDNTGTYFYCPPKLVIYDLVNNGIVRVHEFNVSVVAKANFLNDIALDVVNKVAYISDSSGDGSLVVYDFNSDSSHKFQHSSMSADPLMSKLVMNGQLYTMSSAINGITISTDFNWVFYNPMSETRTYMIPATVLRNPSSNISSYVSTVGRRVSQCDGMVFGKRYLYYGAASLNAVYAWDAMADMAQQGVSMDKVEMRTQYLIAQDDSLMQWPNSFTFDDQGYLYVITNRFPLYKTGKIDFTGASGDNYRVLRMRVPDSRLSTSLPPPVCGSAVFIPSVYTILLLVSVFVIF